MVCLIDCRDGVAVEESYEILSNPRKTYITPPGQGFLPRFVVNIADEVAFRLS
jgi:hypothetical protein